jgi:hypothetical protein
VTRRGQLAGHLAGLAAGDLYRVGQPLQDRQREWCARIGEGTQRRRVELTQQFPQHRHRCRTAGGRGAVRGEYRTQRGEVPRGGL